MLTADLENRRLPDLTSEPIRRGTDGAIDYQYYLANAKRARSAAAIGGLARLGGALRRLLAPRGTAAIPGSTVGCHQS